jgi:hypothetical protein
VRTSPQIGETPKNFQKDIVIVLAPISHILRLFSPNYCSIGRVGVIRAPSMWNVDYHNGFIERFLSINVLISKKSSIKQLLQVPKLDETMKLANLTFLLVILFRKISNSSKSITPSLSLI